MHVGLRPARLVVDEVETYLTRDAFTNFFCIKHNDTKT